MNNQTLDELADVLQSYARWVSGPINFHEDLDLEDTIAAITALITAEYERGRIDEAKTCEKARRHNLRAEKKALLGSIRAGLPDVFVTDGKTDYFKGAKWARNQTIDQVDTLIKDMEGELDV